MAPQLQICFGESVHEESNGIFFDFPFRVMVLRFSYSSWFELSRRLLLALSNLLNNDHFMHHCSDPRLNSLQLHRMMPRELFRWGHFTALLHRVVGEKRCTVGCTRHTHSQTHISAYVTDTKHGKTPQ
jgi:hypothetical protein